MKRYFLLLVLAAGAILESSTAIHAQPLPPSQPQRPTFSPYLNMLRGGNPALNYFGLVRPQQELNQQLGQLQTRMSLASREFQDLEQQVQSGAGQYNPYLPMTGNVARFNDLGNYFDRIGGGGGGGGGGGFSSSFGNNVMAGRSGLGSQAGAGGLRPTFAGSAPGSGMRFGGGFGGAAPGGAAGFGGGGVRR